MGKGLVTPAKSSSVPDTHVKAECGNVHASNPRVLEVDPTAYWSDNLAEWMS